MRLMILLSASLFTFAPAAAQRTPFLIADNSFLVEEAFNQEAGIFQNIFLFSKARDSGPLTVEFTQEWPVGGQRHQFSYTLPYEFDGVGLGNIMLNYRLQARLEDENGPALSPRLSLVLPTGDDLLSYGLDLNLPISRQFGDFYVHFNTGASFERQDFELETISLLSPRLAGSVIYRLAPMFHLMAESVMSFDEIAPACCDTDRSRTWIVSPGGRAAFNFGDHQLVLGAAVPWTLSQSRSAPDFDTRLLFYLSYELPFRKQ